MPDPSPTSPGRTDAQDGTAPRVSVLLVTYNHERYIAQCVESVLAQELDGGWELVIGEDASTDGTRRTLEQYARRDPLRIRLFSREKNLGLHANLRAAWRECRGTYIAMLEGDDYWTDPRKLAKQAAALDSHPDWSMCFHRAQVTNEDGRPPILEPCEDDFPVESGLGDLLRRNFISNVSTMYRRGVVPEIPDSLQRVVQQDAPLHVLHALRGPIGYLPEIMGVWRHHSASMWSSKSESVRWQRIFEFYDLAEDLVGPKHVEAVRLARMESVQRLCTDRERAIESREFRYGATLLRPIRAVRKWLGIIE
jgi:glycosyltransferase involved in cell wall biosynthesis